MCVFWRSLCSKFLNWETILRDYCVDWIIGWVVCWIAFMSVFFSSRKTILKSWLNASSTPPRYLTIRQASQAFFSYRNPNSFSIPSGLIEKALASTITPRHLVDRSSFCSWIWFLVAQYFLDTSVVDDHFLDTYLDSFLDISWHLHLSRFIEGLYILSSRSISHFFDLSQSFRACSSPKHSFFQSVDWSSLFLNLIPCYLIRSQYLSCRRPFSRYLPW